MPATHEHPFQPHYSECDAFGLLQPLAYLRRMQSAAFEASAAVGYDFSHYNELGHLWLVRETEIEYLAPIRYGEQVSIRTWVHDFRRFRSRRRYEIRNLSRGQLAAQASTDWVFLNAARLRPAAIPLEMQQAFYPEGNPPGDETGRSRFPAPAEIPACAFVSQREVIWREIDQMQHVNNANYLAYVEDAAAQLWTAAGWPVARMLAAVIPAGGFRLAPRKQRLEYRIPAVLGDQLTLHNSYTHLTPEHLSEYCAIQRPSDGQLLTQAMIEWRAVDPQTGAPHPIPEQLLADLAPYRVEQAAGA